jgi:hypothetical protein
VAVGAGGLWHWELLGLLKGLFLWFPEVWLVCSDITH